MCLTDRLGGLVMHLHRAEASERPVVPPIREAVAPHRSTHDSVVRQLDEHELGDVDLDRVAESVVSDRDRVNLEHLETS